MEKIKVLGRESTRRGTVKTVRILTEKGKLTIQEAKDLKDKGVLDFRDLRKTERSATVRIIQGVKAPLTGWENNEWVNTNSYWIPKD